MFDTETTGKNPLVCEPVQVAALIYNARTLEPYPDGGFEIKMRPTNWDVVEDDALHVIRKTREELALYPDPQVSWNAFVSWVRRFNTRNNRWVAPIPCGHNIRNFDLPIVERMNALYTPKKGKTVLFHENKSIDLMDVLFLWFENDPELTDFRLGTVRNYFGMSVKDSHDAIGDVRATGELVMRFLKLHRRLRGMKTTGGDLLIKLCGACKGK